MISSTNLISSYFIRNTGRASSQPSANPSNAFPDGIPVGNLIPLMRREFPMGSHNLLFGYRFLPCSDPKLNLGHLNSVRAFAHRPVFFQLLQGQLQRSSWPITRPSFSEERPKVYRRSRATCSFSVSISSALATRPARASPVALHAGHISIVNRYT